MVLSIGQGRRELVWCWGMRSLIKISGRGVQGALGSGETDKPSSTQTGRSTTSSGRGQPFE